MSSLESPSSSSQALASDKMSDEMRNEVAIEIEAMLAKAEAPFTNKCRIYKVPDRLRKLNEDAYTPKVVSIGPFHHGNPSLSNMESQKQIFLKRFIQRTNTDLVSLVYRVEELEPIVRACYSENIKLSKMEFVKIVLVDAGFILELFIWNALRDWNQGDLLSLNSWLLEDVRGDLLLLENQLPFIILDELIRLDRSASVPGSLLDLSFRMFRLINLQNITPQSVADHYPLHFTDLLRTFHLQPESDRSCRRELITEDLLYSATQLHETGVKLQANERSRCLLDLKFSGHVLEIPPLTVGDSTEMLFRNMVALEQCMGLHESYITDYIQILDYLIKKERDVDVLVQKGIVTNWVGHTNDVTKLANGLAKNIFQGDLNLKYNDLCKDLNAFCGDASHIRKATLRRDYCKTPWQTAASVAAILILILTLIQTVFSILQVVL